MNRAKKPDWGAQVHATLWQMGVSIDAFAKMINLSPGYISLIISGVNTHQATKEKILDKVAELEKAHVGKPKRPEWSAKIHGILWQTGISRKELAMMLGVNFTDLCNVLTGARLSADVHEKILSKVAELEKVG